MLRQSPQHSLKSKHYPESVSAIYETIDILVLICSSVASFVISFFCRGLARNAFYICAASPILTVPLSPNCGPIVVFRQYGLEHFLPTLSASSLFVASLKLSLICTITIYIVYNFLYFTCFTFSHYQHLLPGPVSIANLQINRLCTRRPLASS